MFLLSRRTHRQRGARRWVTRPGAHAVDGAMACADDVCVSAGVDEGGSEGARRCEVRGQSCLTGLRLRLRLWLWLRPQPTARWMAWAARQQ